MTSGKSDPNYGPALEAVRKATAAVSGTDPATGQPYAPEYAGLPAELTALQARLLDDAEEAQEVSRWISSESAHIEAPGDGAKRLSEGLYKISAGGKEVAEQAARIDRETKRLAGGAGQARRRRERTRRRARPSSPAARPNSSAASPRATVAPIRCRPGLRRIAVRVALAERQPQPPRGQAAPHLAGDLQLGLLRPLRARRDPRADARTRLRSGRPQRRRPGGDDHGLLPLRLQLARLDRAQQDARRRRRRARQGSGRRHRRRRRPADPQHLQPRDQGADPDHRRRDHPRHLPRP